MFQSWASYLLGGVPEERPSAERPPRIVLTEITPALDVDEYEDDDGWQLVHFDGEMATDEMLRRVNSDSSLQISEVDVEESWFITPPPCFTSTGPSNMRISPFENLLIEHPSMSVYKHAPRRGCLREIHSPPLVRETTPEPEEEEEDDDELEVQEVDNEVAIVRRVIRRHRNEVQLQERQYSRFLHSRKVQLQKASKPQKKTYLERNNKAREVNCRNHRQRRGERSQGPNRSRANNNRKC